MRLSELKIGESGQVLNICCDGAIRRRLLDLGLTPTTIVTLKSVAPFNDPLHITLRNYSLSIRKSEANEVIISRVDLWKLR